MYHSPDTHTTQSFPIHYILQSSTSVITIYSTNHWALWMYSPDQNQHWTTLFSCKSDCKLVKYYNIPVLLQWQKLERIFLTRRIWVVITARWQVSLVQTWFSIHSGDAAGKWIKAGRKKYWNILQRWRSAFSWFHLAPAHNTARPRIYWQQMRLMQWHAT